MRIRRFDFDYGRRAMMEKVAKGAGAAGVLGSVWPMIGNGADITKAYPDEQTSIEGWTKGKIKTGDTISSQNVDVVKDLLDPICYEQVKNMGRTFKIVATPKDPTVLFPHDYLEASLKNNGRAKIDGDGNVKTDDGSNWIGGLPFPESKTGLEAAANITLSWGRHDFAKYGIREWDMGPDGSQAYQYDYVWAEMNITGRMDAMICCATRTSGSRRPTTPREARSSASGTTTSASIPTSTATSRRSSAFASSPPTSASSRSRRESRSSSPMHGAQATRC